MKKLYRVLAALIMCLVGCNCAGQAPAAVAPVMAPDAELREYTRDDQLALVNHMRDRTVSIHHDCTAKEGAVFVGVSNPDTAFDGRGTGVIIRSYDGKSYIYTAAHVVTVDKPYREALTCKSYGYKDADVKNGKVDKSAGFDLSVLVMDEDRDIAVLYAETNLGVSTVLTTDPTVGEMVWTVGYPSQLLSRETEAVSVTSGDLATVYVPRGNVRVYGRYHRVTSHVFFGNSGGGTWDSQGRLVGIVALLFAYNGSIPYPGYYYIKPVDEFDDLLKRNWKYQEVFGSDGL